ncbi:hypothetical protein NEUTE1DRAFT_50929 [Neurospora tetrasperma FGSC 2508]|uniref:Uncharacterized protein n=1 Tax=Neurospora tetrasperma (strain FGSC 2508 / ATCC MYA-4615 / P0657) TaxID=510951 RepID=F8N223_NEUT8|nr:uncharacterized protein NEUTE1DRAFT_50929 [Neurospora tetrasperma FGSC 2508]EGO53247.1 hypothetical protein NEUTE1DRAFT_50929 [Neurospora tetrasperma FGSC 2508]
MLSTYEEAECPGDTVAFHTDRLQRKYQAQLPGSSEGFYDLRIDYTPRPHAYRTLRIRAGLPPRTLRFGVKPSTEFELAYCCTITFTPSRAILDLSRPSSEASWDSESEYESDPPVDQLSSCSSGGVPHEIETENTIIDSRPSSPTNFESLEVSSSVSISDRKGKDRKTGRDCYEIAELHADMEYGGNRLMDLILRYFLDVISLHEAQRPELGDSGWGREREPTVVVMAKNDDADKKFYASHGFVESDEALEVSDRAIESQVLRMVLKEGVIRALVNKRNEEQMDDEDVWTRRRREYEQIWIQAGDRRRDERREEILKESLCLSEYISGDECLETSVGVLCSVQDTPGDGAKRAKSLPLRLHPMTHIKTSEEQGGRRKRAKSVAVSVTSSIGRKERA